MFSWQKINFRMSKYLSRGTWVMDMEDHKQLSCFPRAFPTTDTQDLVPGKWESPGLDQWGPELTQGCTPRAEIWTQVWLQFNKAFNVYNPLWFRDKIISAIDFLYKMGKRSEMRIWHVENMFKLSKYLYKFHFWRKSRTKFCIRIIKLGRFWSNYSPYSLDKYNCIFLLTECVVFFLTEE